MKSNGMNMDQRQLKTENHILLYRAAKYTERSTHS